jgi:hypothetical protein
MTAPDRVISHARVMAAFATLNRQIERKQKQAQTAAQNAAQAQQCPALHRVGSRQFCAGAVLGCSSPLDQRSFGVCRTDFS